MLKKIFFCLFIFTVLTSFSAEWTIMVYLDGDNDLEGDAINDFLEISEIGSNNDVNILVQFDRIEGYNSDYGNWSICHRFYITQGMTPTESNAISDWGDGEGGREVNMGDPQTLTDFINWAKTNYPANKYALILWDHGNGWKNLYQILTKGKGTPVKEICNDETDNDFLSVREVREALENVQGNIDIIGFDACLMGMIEVADEIKNEGSVMVSSEETEPTTGWVYDTFLEEVKKNPEISLYQMAEIIVNSYNAETLSAIDLTKINELNEKLNQLLTQITTAEEWLNVYIARCDSKNFDEPDFVDIYDFFSKLYSSTQNQNIRNSIQEFQNTFIQTVFSDNNSQDNSYGLSVYFPDYGETIDPDYNPSLISFPADTGWDEFLNNFLNADLFNGYTQIFSEDFSSGLPPDWTVIDGYNDGKTWTDTNPGGRNLNLTPPFMIVDRDAAGEVDMDEQLITPPMNFTGYTRIYLKFNQFFLYYSGNEIGDIDIKIGDGNWENVIQYKGVDKEGETIIDISEFVKGESDVKIRWHYYNANYDWYWAIDNVEIWGKLAEKGDLDASGQTDISDVILCLRMAVGLDPVNLSLADMNNDGVVDISDVILILRKAIGLD